MGVYFRWGREGSLMEKGGGDLSLRAGRAAWQGFRGPLGGRGEQ